LPFDTEATIDRAADVLATLRADPRIDRVSAIAGGQLHVLVTPARRGDTSGVGGPLLTAFALGVDPQVQGDYELQRGADITAPDRLVASETFLRAAGVRIGDTIDVAASFDPQLRTYG